MLSYNVQMRLRKPFMHNVVGGRVWGGGNTRTCVNNMFTVNSFQANIMLDHPLENQILCTSPAASLILWRKGFNFPKQMNKVINLFIICPTVENSYPQRIISQWLTWPKPDCTNYIGITLKVGIFSVEICGIHQWLRLTFCSMYYFLFVLFIKAFLHLN